MSSTKLVMESYVIRQDSTIWYSTNTSQLYRIQKSATGT